MQNVSLSTLNNSLKVYEKSCTEVYIDPGKTKFFGTSQLLKKQFFKVALGQTNVSFKRN
jgi:hypothetical protein